MTETILIAWRYLNKIFYPERSNNLENVCFFDFVKLYRYTGKDNNNIRKYCKLNKPIIPNHRIYDPNKEELRDNYYYSLLLLFVPFSSEDDLVDEGETPEQSFHRHLSTNSRIKAHHERLQQLLKSQNKVKEINESGEVQQNKKLDDNEPDKDFPQVMGETKLAMKDIHDLQNNGSKIIDLQKRIVMLNLDQLRIFTKYKIKHLVHHYQHETDQCTRNNFKPYTCSLVGLGEQVNHS